MATYSLAQPGLVLAASANKGVGWEIVTTATDAPRLMEIGYDIQLGGSSVGVFMGRAAVVGIAPANPQVFLAEDPASPPSTVTAATSWGTPPVQPASFLRGTNVSLGDGTGMTWLFPRGIVMPPSSSIILVSLGALTGQFPDFYATVDE